MDLSHSFLGRWVVRNSPANRIPSHGTHQFGTAHAIDFVPVDENGRTAPLRFGSLVKPEPPKRFPGFGREVLAPTAGMMLDVHDGEADYSAFRVGFSVISVTQSSYGVSLQNSRCTRSSAVATPFNRFTRVRPGGSYIPLWVTSTEINQLEQGMSIPIVSSAWISRYP